MRIIEPASKLRTIELLKRYFNISYAQRTVYRLLPQLITLKPDIEAAAYKTARTLLTDAFALVLYDVTTLYFESHEPDDDLKARGFSKDDKSKQPQIVLGLLVTSQGFPLMHEVYKGNTFEGHTMLGILQKFKEKNPQANPIIVADAAMLSQDNMTRLDDEGYQYIVGARLANTTLCFINQIETQLSKTDGSHIRLAYPKRSYEVICSYSEKRARKDRREFEKQLTRAKDLIERKECGRRTKFIKKNFKDADCFVLNEELKSKTEKLLGVKGYITNVPENVLSNTQVVDYYHDLWHVEQSFRVSKTDLQARPIFHQTHDAIKAHVLLCFMALMMGKFLEIKTGLSLRQIRDILWNVHEAHILDTLTGKTLTLQTNLENFSKTKLPNVLLSH
jgi:transposase